MDILVLNGPSGVGKSRIAMDWAEARRGVVIEGDLLRCAIMDEALRRSERFQEALVLDAVKALAQRYLRLERDLVVDYLWHPPAMLDLCEFLAPLGNVAAVLLTCETDINRQRDAGRAEHQVMGPLVTRTRSLLSEAEWPGWLHRVDSTHDAPAQTLARVNALF